MIRKFTAEVVDLTPDNPTAGDKWYRMLSYMDGDGLIPMHDLYQGEFQIVEDGDPENGPSCYLDMGPLSLVEQHYGAPLDILSWIDRIESENSACGQDPQSL